MSSCAKAQADPISTPGYFETVLRQLHAGLNRLPLVSLVARHRLSHVTSGYISRQGWTERWGLGRLRNRVLGGITGDKLRATVLVGGEPLIDLMRVMVLTIQIRLLPLRSPWRMCFSVPPSPDYIQHRYRRDRSLLLTSTTSKPHLYQITRRTSTSPRPSDRIRVRQLSTSRCCSREGRWRQMAVSH